MDFLFSILLILAGALGASSLIVAKKPDAQQIIDKLLPFQALIGAGTLVLGILTLLRIGPKALLDITRQWPVFGGTVLAAIISGILLGFMFAIPLMGRLGAGQQKAAELAQKLAPWQLLIGLAAAGSGLLLLLFSLHILPVSFFSNM